MSFADEIRRLVKSPYPVSLKSQHALSVLEKLAQASSIRNIILGQNPVMLEQLLSRACSSSHRSSLLSSTCITLLGEALLAGMAVPRSMHGFVASVANTAIQSPSAVAFRQLYSLLNYRQAPLLEELPEEAVQDVLQQLLRSLKQSETQSMHLLCLGVLARLMATRKRLLPQDSQPRDVASGHPSKQQHDSPSNDLIVQFFDGQKASKTVQLVVLQVILACSTDGPSSSDDAVDDILLATEIADAVSLAIKSSWVESSPKAMAKLYERTLRPTLSVSLRLLALEFLLAVAAGKKLPDSIASAFEGAVSSYVNPPSIDSQSARVSERLIKGYTRQASPMAVKNLFLAILNTSTQHTSPTAKCLQSHRVAMDVLDELSTATQNVSPRGSLAYLLRHDEVLKVVNEFIGLTAETSCRLNCDATEICPIAFAEAQRQLAFSICSFLLEVLLHAAADRSPPDMGVSIRLLRKQQALALFTGSKHEPVPHEPTPSAQRLSLLKQVSTSNDANITTIHWRERLAAELFRESTQKNEAIIRHFEGICRDLDERCQHAEAPWREEQSRTAALTVQLDQAQSVIAQLQSEAVDQGTRLDDVEAERQRLDELTSDLTAQMRSSDEEERQAKERLEEALGGLEARLVSATDNSRTRDLEHVALLALKDEMAEALQARLQSSEELLEHVRSELDDANRAKSMALQQMKDTESSLLDQARDAEEQQTIMAKQQEEMIRLEEVEQQLRQDLRMVETEMEASSSENKMLRAQLDADNERWRRRVTHLQEAQVTAAQEAALEEARLRESHQIEIAQLEVVAGQARDDALQEAKRQRSKIVALEKQVGRLERQGEANSKELAEAEGLRQQLRALVMASNGGLRKSLPDSPSLPDSQDETLDDAAFRMQSTWGSQDAAGDDRGGSMDDGGDDEPMSEEHHRASCTSLESSAPLTPTPRQALLLKQHMTKRSSASAAMESRQRRSVATAEPEETSAGQSTKWGILRESNMANRQRRKSPLKEAYTAFERTELAEHVGAE